MRFHNWQKHPTPPGPPYNKASPNLKALLSYALSRFRGTNLGIYNVRPASGLTVWSAHAYGAANDWGYTDRAKAIGYIDFLIANHLVLGVQMIVDEGYDRAWKCWRDELGGPGWKSSPINGGNWLHIETHPDNWFDATPIADRLAPPTPDPVPPAPTPTKDLTMYLEWRAGQPDYTGFIYTGTHLSHAVSGDAVNVAIRGGAVKVVVTDIELLAVIQSSACTTAAPWSLTPAMSAAWG